MDFQHYDTDGFYDELFARDGRPRPGTRQLVEFLERPRRIFPTLKVRPVDGYPMQLLDMLRHTAPAGVDELLGALLTPGAFNSA